MHYANGRMYVCVCVCKNMPITLTVGNIVKTSVE